MIKTEVNLESGKPISEIVRLHCEMVYAYIRAEGWDHNINGTNKFAVNGIIKMMKSDRKGYQTITITSRINLPQIFHEVNNGIVNKVIEEIV